MHPAFLDNMSWEMAEVYGAITDQILINLARYFPFYEYVDDLPTSAFTYQAQMLAQMGQVNKETIRIIRNGLSDADLALQGVLEQAVIDAVKTAEPELLEAVKKGVFAMPTTPVVAPNQMRAFQLYYEQAADKLNLVNTVMLESTQSAYQQAVSDVVSQIEIADRLNRTQIALDAATGEIVTGVSSWNQAIKHATDRLKDGGIVGFIDHAGRQWSAEAYVAMDMRTTVFNTGRAATWETNQNFGNDLYIVSYHNGARPLCYPWQNKVISSMDSSRKVVDLDGNEIQVIPQSQTSYGQAAGLFGINCKHYPTPFIPGVSVIEGHPQDPEANAKTYEESQKQRALERKLREEKRDLQMLKAQGASEEDIAKQQAKCRQTSADIDEFCKETGRARHRDREAVYTKREFPDADRYDVDEFKKDQQDLINNYYQIGGEQKGFTFGKQNPDTGELEVLTPKAPIVPQQNQNVASQVTQSTPPVVQSATGSPIANTKDFTELRAYMNNTYGVTISQDVDALEFTSVRDALIGVDRVAKDFPEFGKQLTTIGTEKSGVMACVGDKITFTPKYFTDRKKIQGLCDSQSKSGWWVKNSDIPSLGEHESGHGIEAVLIKISGKYQYSWEQADAWNNCTEAKAIVSEAVKTIKKTPYGKGKKKADLLGAISGYAKDNASESMAEAFADYYVNGTNANPLSIEIFNVTKRIYNSYLGGTP